MMSIGFTGTRNAGGWGRICSTFCGRGLVTVRCGIDSWPCQATPDQWEGPK